jgi:hypothetical protein
LKNGDEIEYDINDPGFKTLMQCLALGTKSQFSYKPTLDEIRTYLAKKDKKLPKDYANLVVPEEKHKEIEKILLDIEKKLPMNERNTTGDASEKGLVKFYNSIQDLD